MSFVNDLKLPSITFNVPLGNAFNEPCSILWTVIALAISGHNVTGNITSLAAVFPQCCSGPSYFSHLVYLGCQHYKIALAALLCAHPYLRTYIQTMCRSSADL